ncbi:MAG: 2-oxo-4-hydroxy-4-carboxy-5-ureidoimidazoline decarboxylase [Allorhizobium sp.]
MVERSDFVERFGGVFEHSPFIAERAYDAGLIEEPLSALEVHDALCAMFRTSSRQERLAVLKAHPDLAGKLAIDGGLTEDSRLEQAGAGLDRLSADEHARFTELNAAYVEKFGFPFIIAVKGLDREAILNAFEIRVENGVDQEFETAAAQVEKIARLRLESMFPENENV